MELCDFNEKELINWINESMKQGWRSLCESCSFDSSSHLLQKPKVTNFHEDLSNGVVLAAVLANYAPFLVNYL